MGGEPDPRTARSEATGLGRSRREGRRRGSASSRSRLSVAIDHALRALTIGLALTIVAACGASPAPSVRAVPSARAAEWGGALLDLVPEGAHLVVVAHPARLFEADATRAVILALSSEARLDAFRDRVGVDLRTVDELVFAEAPDGTVLLARGEFGADMAVIGAGSRMLPLESSSDAPFLRRSGYYRGARRELIALGAGVAAVVTGAPGLTQAVLSRARGQGRDRGALDGPAVADLLAVAGDAPLVVLAPEPLALPPGPGVAMLLARERALAGVVRPLEGGVLGIDVHARGEFPPGADENARRLFESVATSDLGSLLGMRHALPTLSARAEEDRLSIHALLPAEALVVGLRALFEAEIAELVDAPETGTPAPTTRPMDGS